MDQDLPLQGRRILLVEDELLISMMLEDVITGLGATVVGPAYSADRAEQLAATSEIDAAMLDVNLNGTMSYGVADILESRSIPFFFLTGYGATQRPDALVLSKPFKASDVRDTLIRICRA